jgi:hypothetical protein
MHAVSTLPAAVLPEHKLVLFAAAGWDVAAISDKAADYSGSCG